MTDNERETIIRTAIKYILSKGIGLTRQTWGISYNNAKELWQPSTKPGACCPMAAIVLEHQASLPWKQDVRSLTVQAILDTNSDWVSSFQKGWDGYDRQTAIEGLPFEMGASMWEEFFTSND